MAHNPETCPYLSEVVELQEKHEERCRETAHAFDHQTPKDVLEDIERCVWCGETRACPRPAQGGLR